MSGRNSRTGRVVTGLLERIRTALGHSTVGDQLPVPGLWSTVVGHSHTVAAVTSVRRRVESSTQRLVASIDWTVPVRGSITVRTAAAVTASAAMCVTAGWRSSAVNDAAVTTGSAVTARPVQLVSTTILAALVVNTALMIAFGTPTRSTVTLRLPMTGLALAGLRVTATWEEIRTACRRAAGTESTD